MAEKTLNLLVNGMKHAEDVKKLEAALENITGVIRVQTMFEANTVRVIVDDEQSNAEKIRQTIKELGFTVK